MSPSLHKWVPLYIKERQRTVSSNVIGTAHADAITGSFSALSIFQEVPLKSEVSVSVPSRVRKILIIGADILTTGVYFSNPIITLITAVFAVAG